jgi:hypothetical protein
MGTVVIVALIVSGVVGMSAYKQIKSEERRFFDSPRIVFGDEGGLLPRVIENKEPIILFPELHSSATVLLLPEKSA